LITRWDLDKTYLYTEFDTLQDLVRTALEKPEQKRDVPGAAPLLKELAKSGVRVHIVSGSPRQLGPRLARKLSLDGVHYDRLSLKPNLSHLLRLRFRALHDRLGYTLPGLLQARLEDQERAPAAQEILVGDDSEADALVYSLYADVCAGHVDERQLSRVLSATREYKDSQRACLRVLDQLKKRRVVSRILLHLDRQSPPSRFWVYGKRLVPFYNYLQAAYVLAEDHCLSGEAVLAIARDFVDQHRFDSDALARSYRDLMRRGHADGSLVEKLKASLSPAHGKEMEALVEGLALCVQQPPAPVEVEQRPLDYVSLAYHARGQRRRRSWSGY